MAHIPTGFRYTTEHEYLQATDDPEIFRVGITDYAQSELGDIVYIELPEPGDAFVEMEPFGTIEAVKAVSDLFCPVTGEIVAVNEALDASPELVNSDPYEEGWMVMLRVEDPSEVDDLLDHATYAEHIEK